MEPNEFRQWRKSLGWKQKDAAEKLGLKKRVIQYYEKGDRDGKAVAIPRSVELACLALALGHEKWDLDIATSALDDAAKFQAVAQVEANDHDVEAETVLPAEADAAS